MWLVYALCAGLLYTAEGLIARHVMRAKKDAWAFSFYFSAVGALVSLPFMLMAPTIPHTITPWLLAGLVGLLLVGHNLLSFLASKHLEASLGGAVSKIRLVWVFILSVALLGEQWSWGKFMGTLLAFAAGAIIVHGVRRTGSAVGVMYVLAATLFYAFLIILYKYLFRSFNTVSLTFFVTFLPAAILNFVLMPKAVPRIVKLYKEDGRMVLAGCGLGALANLAMNAGLESGEATAVLVIMETFLIVTLVGEHILLREKEQMWVKVAAVTLAVAGAILIRISS